MFKKILLAAAAPLAVLGSVALGGAAHAVTPPTTVTATTHVTDRPDSGNGGTWAYDTFDRTLTVTADPAHNTATQLAYTATVSDKGDFSAIVGAKTPNQSTAGAVIAHGVHGDMTGSISYTVLAPNTDTLTGVVPATEADSFGTNPKLVTTGVWPVQAFATAEGVQVTEGTDWSWTYKTACESWTDAANNGDGNIAVDGNIAGTICPKPAPVPYVYAGHVVTVTGHNAVVGWSDSAEGWPSSNHCVEVFIYGFDRPAGQAHVGFTCDNGNPANDLGYLRSLAPGHTYALFVQPAEGVYGNNHPIANTNPNAHITVITTAS